MHVQTVDCVDGALAVATVVHQVYMADVPLDTAIELSDGVMPALVTTECEVAVDGGGVL